jgi:integrase
LAARPRPKSAGGLTLRDLCNQFLSAKQSMVAAGDITQRHFDDLYRGCEMVLTAFGKHRMVDDLRPDDFRQLRAKLAKKWKAASGLSRTIMGIRQIFNWAYKNELVDRPVRFGTEFSTPPKKRRRLEQNTHDRMLQPQDIPRLADDASVELRAMILLAVNCGFGNADLKTLDVSSLDLDNAWYDGARRKTGVKRAAKLWDETVDAIHKVIDKRQPIKLPLRAR